MLFNPLMKLGLAGLLLVCGATFAMSDNKNYAYQLQLKNCGGYYLNAIKLQKKKSGSSSWSTVQDFGFQEKDMTNGHSWCIDISSYGFKSGDQARLKAYIDSGNTVNCDGTNYGGTSDQKSRRSMKMAGTTLNNNGCRTKSYAYPLSSKCSSNGTRKYEGACS